MHLEQDHQRKREIHSSGSKKMFEILGENYQAVERERAQPGLVQNQLCLSGAVEVREGGFRRNKLAVTVRERNTE